MTNTIMLTAEQNIETDAARMVINERFEEIDVAASTLNGVIARLCFDFVHYHRLLTDHLDQSLLDTSFNSTNWAPMEDAATKWSKMAIHRIGRFWSHAEAKLKNKDIKADDTRILSEYQKTAMKKIFYPFHALASERLLPFEAAIPVLTASGKPSTKDGEAVTEMTCITNAGRIMIQDNVDSPLSRACCNKDGVSPFASPTGSKDLSFNDLQRASKSLVDHSPTTERGDPLSLKIEELQSAVNGKPLTTYTETHVKAMRGLIDTMNAKVQAWTLLQDDVDAATYLFEHGSMKGYVARDADDYTGNDVKPFTIKDKDAEDDAKMADELAAMAVSA